MARTPEELEDLVTSRLRAKIKTESLTWQEFVQVVQGMSAERKGRFVREVIDKNPKLVDFLNDLIEEAINAKARTEAKAMLADGNIDLVELDRLF